MTEISSWIPKVHERCFVYHGPVIYSSTVIAVHEANSPDITFKKRGLVDYEKLVEELSEKGNQKINTIPTTLFSINTYYVHYKDWSKDWDEWVTIDRILPYDDENIKKAKEMKNEILKAGKSGKISISVSQDPSFTSPVTIINSKNLSAGFSEKNPEKADPSTIMVSQESNGLASLFQIKGKSESIRKIREQSRGNLITLEVPVSLRKKLVHDCENIKLNNMLVSLPSPIPISDILTMYQSHFNTMTDHLKKTHTLNIDNIQKRAGSEDYANDHLLYSEFLTEFISTIKGFFERCIEHIILYDEEKDQFRKLFRNSQFKRRMLNNGSSDTLRKFSDYYGVEHFLRMIIVLPSLVSLQSPILFAKDSEFEDLDMQCKSLLKFFLQSMIEFIDLKFSTLYGKPDNRYYIAIANTEEIN